MNELRAIVDGAPPNSFIYTADFLDYEQYKIFNRETAQNIGLALLAVFLVVLFLTGNVLASAYVILSVTLVDLNLFACMWYWGLTLNSVTVVNLVIAVGLAVDYSAHIAHSYLLHFPDDQLARSEQRREKSLYALGTIGSSVFHGAFSTFLAVVTLAGSQSYIFLVFFRMWTGIIIFGILHGFVLLPVLLSFLGPLNKKPKEQEQDYEEEELHKRLNELPDTTKTNGKHRIATTETIEF